jgi:N,N'-diacetyllegionaminate synthase
MHVILATVDPISVNGRKIGAGEPCYVLAEAGVNHNGDLGLAHKLVDTAADAGADAVKFQTFSADRLVTRRAPKAEYQQQRTGADESQHAMLKQLELDEAEHLQLLKHCQDRGILFVSTPFDEQSADMLERLGVRMFKMSSGELTNLPFQAHVARKGKPVVVSTGMGTMEEIAETVATVRSSGSPPLALLHCVSAYPTPPEDANLLAMSSLHVAFAVPVGWSDHTMGLAISFAAVALGACVLEKHFTLDRSLPGPDHVASLEPDELKALIAGVKEVGSAIGDGRKRPRPAELNVIDVARKSLVAARDLKAGNVLASGDIAVLRPGTGMAPKYRDFLIGRRLNQDRAGGTLFEPADFE